MTLNVDLTWQVEDRLITRISMKWKLITKNYLVAFELVVGLVLVADEAVLAPEHQDGPVDQVQAKELLLARALVRARSHVTCGRAAHIPQVVVVVVVALNRRPQRHIARPHPHNVKQATRRVTLYTPLKRISKLVVYGCLF